MANKKLIRKITCSNEYVCFVSVENVDEKSVVKFDFKIKSYDVCKAGWRTYQFPENIVIDDKLYLDENLKNKIINLLQTFVDTTYVANGEHQVTNRGFAYHEIPDLRNNIISIQESSSNGAFLWFGCSNKIKENIHLKDGDKLVKYECPHDDISLTQRLHLSISNTKKLIKTINELWKLNEVRILDKELAVNSFNKKPNKI